ncbi:unnamed protein product [Malus baccata var. baccata]
MRMNALRGPKYDGKYLRKLLRKILGYRRLHETVTRIVVPTFDIKLLQPHVFSTFEAEIDTSEDALLSDALLAMKPTGTLFPGSPDALAAPQSLDYQKYIMLSLGSGTSKIEKKYDAKVASKWGILGWLYRDGHSPLVDAFTFASGDMVDLHIGHTPSTDKATKKNMKELVRICERLLHKPVSRMNLDTGIFEPAQHQGTNEQALTRFANLLSEERRLRKERLQRWSSN